MVELKPCPFCGGEAYCSYEENYNRYMVKCFDCGATVSSLKPRVFYANKYDMDDIIFKWNKRVEKNGYWMENENGSTCCSECGYEVNTNINNTTYKYCPECGARMENV